MTSRHTCPVCGYPELEDPPHSPAAGPSHEICPSCGFHFGYDDDVDACGEEHTYASWRERWVAAGMRWWSQGIDRRPDGWDPAMQVLAALRLDELTARLRAAGCVFAEEEAQLIIDSGGDVEARTARRVAGEPLEYVLGFADFGGVRVALEPGVFIPRRRTAWLVHRAAALAPPGAVVLDLCCGSGALGLALASRADVAELHATDADPVATRCATGNLAPVGGHVHTGDLFDALPAALRGRVDVLLANVPYVPTDALDTMPVEAREHEPRATHDGGGDGLDVLRRVLADAPVWLAPGGHLLVEIAEEQDAAARAAFAAAGFDLRIETSDDDGATIAVGTPVS